MSKPILVHRHICPFLPFRLCSSCCQGRSLTFEPYTLAPVATTLTSLELLNCTPLSLALSVAQCSNLQRLHILGLTGRAAAPELLVQLVRSLPLLRELELRQVVAPPHLQVSQHLCACVG